MKDWRVEHRPVEHRALGEFNPHFKQLRVIAQRAGADLGEALLEGRITEAEYSAAITRCRAASCLQACAYWLEAPSPDHPPVPDFCANREAFEGLRRKG